MSRAAFIRQAVRERVEAIARADEWVRERDDRLPGAADRTPRASQPPQKPRLRPRPPKPPLPPARERQIREMYTVYLTGATLAQVGATYGVSPERVRQLFARLDLPRRHPAAHHKSEPTPRSGNVALVAPQRVFPYRASSRISERDVAGEGFRDVGVWHAAVAPRAGAHR